MVTTGYLEHDVAVEGLKLHYQEWGNPSSPTILMLHGFGVSGHMFDEFAERMQDRYHLVALDQRGHGDSDWSDEGDYSREAFVADVERFREALGIERFILCGHSMGGLNAVAYTIAHRQNVRALILVDVGPESAKEGVDNIVRFTRGPDDLEFEEFVQMAHRFNQRRTLENIRERMRHRLKPTSNGKYTWKFDKRFRQEDNGLRIGGQLSNDETWQLFREVGVPTLIVRGAESDVLDSDVAQRAAREMQRARLVEVAGAGHSVPGDNPDDFTAAVREFLGDLESGRFEPVAATEPPPLTALMEEHEVARKRGSGIVALILIGIGAAVALAGAAFLLRKATGRKKQRRIVGRTRKTAPLVGQFKASDVDRARERATELVSELAAMGRSGVSSAQSALHDVDLERARRSALDLAHALGDRSRTAPATVRTAASHVDTKKLRKRGRKAAKRGRTAGGTALQLAALGATRLLAARGGGRRKKHRRTLAAPWRR